MGQVLLINIMDYDNAPSMKRVGSDIDAVKLTSTFTALGFNLYKDQVHTNLRHGELHQLIKDYAQEESSCSAVVIMAHGDNQGRILTSDHSAISIHNGIYPLFSNENAPLLKGKPK